MPHAQRRLCRRIALTDETVSVSDVSYHCPSPWRCVSAQLACPCRRAAEPCAFHTPSTMSRLPSQPPQQLPNLPDFTPPQQHRLKTLTFLASAVILVAGVTADYSQGPSGSKPHVFTAVSCCSCCLSLRRVHAWPGSHTTRLLRLRMCSHNSWAHTCGTCCTQERAVLLAHRFPSRAAASRAEAT